MSYLLGVDASSRLLPVRPLPVRCGKSIVCYVCCNDLVLAAATRCVTFAVTHSVTDCGRPAASGMCATALLLVAWTVLLQWLETILQQ
jgi:hypothetical protein